MANEGLNEQEVVIALASGDVKAFQLLFDQYNRRIFQFISKYIPSVPLAEDLTQEVFIKIWDNRKNLLAVQSFKAYLFITARNHTLNSLKKTARSEITMGEVLRGYAEERNTTEDEMLTREYLEFINRVLETLPLRTREIFRACREHGCSYEEVAQAMGISRNAVKNHMVQSMKVLRTSAQNEFGVSLSILLAAWMKS